MDRTYKVIWWNDLEQNYTESKLSIDGVDFLIQCIGAENVFTIEG